MAFIRHGVYNFEYAGVTRQNGVGYFLLRYDGAETMSGYEQWVFRVEILEFQQAWNEEEIWSVFPCYVAGFLKDEFGQETAFPILKQDMGTILSKEFVVGKSYVFTVAACPGDQNERLQTIDHYLVSDRFGFKHPLKTSASYRIGDEIELTVDKIEPPYLKFADPVRRKIKELFTVGKEYDFRIESEEYDDNSRKNFFTLRDTLEGFLHRFYFTGEHKSSPGESIRLTVKGITPKGWLLLIEPGKAVSDEELQTLEQIEDNTFGRENEQLEYKSSFAFTASGEQDIDAQLGREIMQQLAAFMNARGGMVCLGYRDDGSICGINNDISYLNSSRNDDFYSYRPTLNDIELKIRNTIGQKLGGFANGLVTIEFRKTEADLLVCHLIARPSTKPIFVNNTYLYKRSGNMCQRLFGDEITFFVLEHLSRMMQNTSTGLAAANNTPIPVKAEQTKAIAPQDLTSLNSFPPVPAPARERRRWYTLTLYRDGTVSKQKEEVDQPDVLFNIPLTADCENKSARMLFCYDNGCVNILNPGAVVTEKLNQVGQRYCNGFNTGAGLLAVFICSKEDFLIVHSKTKDDVARIKAVAVGNYRVHNPHSMQTPGNKILDTNRARVVGFEVVPGCQSSFIYPIIMRARNGVPGYPAQNLKYQNVLAFLKRRGGEAKN